MGVARRVFLAATGQNRGKTTASLGLMAGIGRRGRRLGFLKPVGQRYLMVDGDDTYFAEDVQELLRPIERQLVHVSRGTDLDLSGAAAERSGTAYRAGSGL